MVKCKLTGYRSFMIFTYPQLLYFITYHFLGYSYLYVIKTKYENNKIYVIQSKYKLLIIANS